MSRPAALGFDVGTTTVKAGLLWLDHEETMLTVARPYPTVRPQPGWVEQDPREWIDAMAACWAEVRARAGALELHSVGICSQVNTHVFTDERLNPLRPAITWQDVRAAGEAAELDAAADARRTELWGGPFTIDASFSLSRMAWLANHEPHVLAATRWLLQPRDFCLAVLTGEVLTDPLSPVGQVGPDGGYLEDVLALVDRAAGLVPPLRAFDTAAGATIADNKVGLPPGVPVAVGTMDAWGSLLGAGLGRPGRALDLAGTSEVVAVSALTTTPTQGIVSFPPVHGVHVHAGPTQAGGAALEWVAGAVGLSLPEALEAARVAADDPQPIVFLPHLAGERAPYWNPDARGVFLGLTASTRSGDLVLAVLEGVAHAVCMLLEACEQAAGAPADTVRLAGGGARSPLWNQLKADAVGRPVEVLAEAEAGVLGALLLGLAASDPGSDVVSLSEERVRVARTIEPRPGPAARMSVLHEIYADTYRAIEPLFPRLSGESAR